MTASEAYYAQQEKIGELIKELDSLIDDHNAQATQKAIHWGHVGDLQHVTEVIAQATRFLKEED